MYSIFLSIGEASEHGITRPKISSTTITVESSKIGVEEIAIKQAGVQALESFLLARYYMFSQIYMSPKERLFRVLYCNEMKELLPDGMFPRDVRKFLQLDDTKYIRRLKCINTMPYGLVYDGEFNLNIKNLLDRKLNGYLMCDTPRKTIFRRDTDDSTVMVVDDILGQQFNLFIFKPDSQLCNIQKSISSLVHI